MQGIHHTQLPQPSLHLLSRCLLALRLKCLQLCDLMTTMASAAQVTLLKAHFETHAQELQPILTALNGDNSWLVSIPRPLEDRAATGKFYYHVVYEPWLVGPAVAFASWIMTITLPATPVYQNEHDVEALVREIEQTAAGCIGRPDPASDSEAGAVSPIDALWIGMDIEDHLHEPTMRLFNPAIPVFATADSAKTIRRWKHFRTVVTTADLAPNQGASWLELHPGAPLPPWLHIFKLPTSYFLQWANVIVWERPGGAGAAGGPAYEALVTSPHGVRLDSPAVATYVGGLEPAVKTTAILHALKESFSFGIRTTLGASGGLTLQRASQARYWVSSAESALKYWGLVALFTRDVSRTMQWALEEEETRRRRQGETAPLSLPGQFVHVDMGSSIVLE